MHLAMKVSVVVFLSCAIFILLLYKFWNHGKVDGLLDLYPCDNKTVFKCLPHSLAASYYPPIPAFVKPLKQPTSVNEPSGYDVTVLVKSRVENFSKRKAIRLTWGSVSSFRGKSLCVIFIVGVTSTQDTEVELQDEVETYGDILQLSVKENFADLPRKSLSAFHWIYTSWKSSSKFYIMADDDCVINVANTIGFLIDNEADMKKSIHCGHMFERNAGVIRGHGKRSVPFEIYPYEFYPDFCRGGMVILSHFFIQKIYQAATVTNFTGFHLEDVLLYGILREKLGIKDSISNVINGGLPLVYYPWDDTDVAISKMLMKWKDWKATLEPFEGTMWRSHSQAALPDNELEPK